MTADPLDVSWIVGGVPSAEPPLPPYPGEMEEEPPEPIAFPRGMRPARAHEPAVDRLPPDALDAEQAVLGAVLAFPEAMIDALELLTPADFHKQAHGLIFAAMSTLYGVGQAPNVVAVANQLERTGDLEAAGGAAYVGSLSQPTSVYIGQHAAIVADAARSRRLIETAGKIAQLGYERDPEAAERALEMLRGVSAGGSSSGDIMARTGARCLAQVSPAPAPAPHLGFLDPDGHTILHGMGGVGKGVLTAHWMARLASDGHRVLLADYEGHPGEWARRIHGLGGADALAAICYVSPSSADWSGHRGAIWTQAGELRALAVEWEATYLVIDSIIPACGAIDPLKPEAAGQYAAALVRIGLPALSLAHVTKADSPAYPFGSIFWHNLARMSWSLTRDGETIQLVSRKANNYDRLGRFVVSATWFEGALGEVALTPYSVVLADRIAEALAAEPLTVPELVDRLNEEGADTGESEIKADSVRHALRRGLKAGIFACEGDRWLAS
jgi:hypothetical protein